ncbi:uncharacterized protein LOC129766529 [Toxorhynchites rutilus septentrionalis]|uniref:uncharacterized protein LOC129766529 n=1 Tax=Toxorhynchites rutilus septentrionalis TaxID=329112 RepID=UPI00247AD7BE|nr:uncharacterized protein LOC129766529 [Toxorhynchites rutilus septentrionalis]
MKRIICFIALISIIAANTISVPETASLEAKKAISQDQITEGNDDLEGAETLGFGFKKSIHKHIHITPPYGAYYGGFPRGYYNGYYPSYGYHYGYPYRHYGYGHGYGYDYPYYRYGYPNHYPYHY